MWGYSAALELIQVKSSFPVNVGIARIVAIKGRETNPLEFYSFCRLWNKIMPLKSCDHGNSIELAPALVRYEIGSKNYINSHWYVYINENIHVLTATQGRELGLYRSALLKFVLLKCNFVDAVIKFILTFLHSEVVRMLKYLPCTQLCPLHSLALRVTLWNLIFWNRETQTLGWK